MGGRSESERAALLVAACEALLGGSYAEFVRARGGLPTAWTVLNLPAHGTRDELERDVLSTGAGSSRWALARSFLCREVLDTVDRSGASLRQIQDEVLVPLELAVCDQRLDFGTTLGRVVASAVDALARRRGERRAPGERSRAS